MFEANQVINDHFAVLAVTEKVTKKGDKFLIVELAHPNGLLDGKVWSDSLSRVDLRKNTVVEVEGVTDSYNGKVTLTIRSAQVINSKTLDQFLPKSKTPTVVFDIETVGRPFDELTEGQQIYLQKNLEKNTDPEIAKTKTGLYPLFGFVGYIALLNPDTQKGKIIGLHGKDCVSKDERYVYQSTEDEAELLTVFWDMMSKFERFVTFNGHDFDWPFLIFRSAVNRVVIPIEFQHNGNNFIDLMKKIKGGGRQYTLEMTTQALGISDPKAEGVHGNEVTELYEAGQYQKIIDYVGRDVVSTAELYQIWKTYLAGKVLV